MKKPRMTWKRDSRFKGLAAVAQGTRGSTLSAEGIVHARTVFSDGRHGYKVGWWWAAYANGGSGMEYKNTCRTPVDTEEEAKRAAKKYVTSQIDNKLKT